VFSWSCFYADQRWSDRQPDEHLPNTWRRPGGPSPPGLALLAFAIPLWPTWHYGWRARVEGVRTAMLPFVVVVVLVAGFTILDVVPMGQ